ncbi:MAG: MarR family transcriptional regulator [Candidatus Dormiibacterota bacterium]|jgi:DNA-binding MarR family transcriptional regulator
MDGDSEPIAAERVLRELARLHDDIHVLFRPVAEGSALEGPGLSSRQAHALYVITTGTIWMSELANRLRMSQAGTTTVVDRLVELELVTRERDASDRRLIFLTATDGGRDLIEKGNVWEQKALAALGAALQGEVPKVVEQCVEGLVKTVEAAVEELEDRRARPDEAAVDEEDMIT